MVCSPSPSSSGRLRVACSSGTDAFRPNLPSDPFTDFDGHRPWIFQHEELKQLFSSEQFGCKIILILGEPSSDDLNSLLAAPSLRESLLLIVTSLPPRGLLAIPEPSPSVQILRLLSPIALKDPGAHHLLSILQRAEVVARRWRKYPDGFAKRGQLRESQPGGAFTVSEECGFHPNSSLSNYSRPLPPTPLKPVSTPSAKQSFFSRLALVRPSRETADKIRNSFDALINFVPSSFSDKAILKYIILLTTLSQSFLVSSSIQATRLPTTSQSQPTSRSASPTFKRDPRNALKIATFARRFPSLLTSFNTLPEHNVRQAETSRVSDVSNDDDQTRSSSRHARNASSRSHPVPVPPSSDPTGLLLSEPRRTRSHIIHVLPSSVPTHTFLSTPRNQSLVPGVSSPAVFQPYSRLVDTLNQESAKKSKLLQSIEQFLCSYSYPPFGQPNVNRYSNPSLHGIGGPPAYNVPDSASGSEPDPGHDISSRQVRMNERAAAYVVCSGVLGHKPHIADAQRLSSVKDDSDSPAAVVEMLLLGLLDPDSSFSPSSFSPDDDTCTQTPSLPRLDFVTSPLAPRVWIGHPDDVVIKPSGVSSIPTRSNAGVDVQEENEIKVVERYLTMINGLEERGGHPRVRDERTRSSDFRIIDIDSRMSTANTSLRPEGTPDSSGSASGSSTVSGEDNPGTITSKTGASHEVLVIPQKMDMKTQNWRATLTGRLRRMSGGWKIWIRKSVDVS
ncbi:hypothetical protein L218DRAFT_264336 [Marasmius fiardii PR-910]|nr:hypothetical protein L218DRAFT_264336 [Marasmius fiardii PR-910]